MDDLLKISISNPLALFLFLLIPIIWKTLKIYPLLPKLIKFPAIILIAKYKSIDDTPQKKSYFVLVLRILLLSSLIFALSDPIFNKVKFTQKNSLIVIDNSWLSSLALENRKQKILNLYKSLDNKENKISLITTAEVSKGKVLFLKEKSYKEIYNFLFKIKSFPWEANYKLVEDKIENTKFDSIYWFTEGIINNQKKILIDYFKTQKNTELYISADLPDKIPPIFELKKRKKNSFEFLIKHPLNKYSSGTVNAFDKNKRLIYRNNFKKEVQKVKNFFTTKIIVDIPLGVSEKILYFQLDSIEAASAKIYLSEIHKQKVVGIVIPKNTNSSNQLNNGSYYLKKSIQKYFKIKEDNLEKLLESNLSIIYLDDKYINDPTIEKKLISWIENGGTLVKFGGENLVKQIKIGDYNFINYSLALSDETSFLNGSLSFKESLKLSNFDKNSLFSGINIPSEVKIKKYIQTKAISTNERIISLASLENGAPLISFKKSSLGKIFFFHIPCNGQWSNLALSYLFVELNQRIINTIEGVKVKKKRNLRPYFSIDGNGNLKDPSSEVLNIKKKKDDQKYKIKYSTPPGLYKDKDGVFAINLGNNLLDLFKIFDFEDFKTYKEIEVKNGISLQNPLIIFSLMMFFMETLIILYRKKLLNFRFNKVGMIFIFLFYHTNLLAIDGNSESFISKTRLGFITTNDPKINEINENGLSSISEYIVKKTAANLGSPHPINLLNDELFYFPVIYWTITENTKSLSRKIVQKINNYTENGGMLLVDCKSDFDNLVVENCIERLSLILPLNYFSKFRLVDNNHSISKSFYLLKDFPGTKNNKIFYSLFKNQINNEGASIVLGNNNWTDSWARNMDGNFLLPILDNLENQRLISLRFGINLIIHALTGNYKTDQVHIPEILKRMKN